MASNLFERLGQQPPEKEWPVQPEIQSGPLLRPVVPPADPQSPPIEKLLDWLLNRWTKDTINTRLIRIYGPNSSGTAGAQQIWSRYWLSGAGSHPSRHTNAT